MKQFKDELPHLLNSLVFLLLIFIGGILFFILPKETISEDEKRKLAQVPAFTYSNFISGKLTDSLDRYYSDNFIFRNRLISIANRIKEYTGFKNQEIRFYNKPKVETADDTEIETPSVEKASDTTGVDSTSNNIPKIHAGPEEYSDINSVIIYKKMAVQLYGGSNKALKNYANMILHYKEELSPDMKIYCITFPVGADFFLPNHFNKTREKTSIDYFYSVLHPSIISVKSYDEIEKHKDEYIQFNTDHHWTGRGAYYAYMAFCEAAGIQSVPMDQMTRKVIPNFLGTLYYYTLCNDLKENIDSVEYFKIPTNTKTYYFMSGMTNAKPSTLYAEHSRGGNSYGVFLGLDYPLMRIISEVKNGKKILVLKDSYGNAFIPFLPSHYEEVFVIDYRYFDGNIKELVQKYGIAEIAFAHNLVVFNSSYAVKRETSLLYSLYTKPYQNSTPKTIKTDSTIKKKHKKAS